MFKRKFPHALLIATVLTFVLITFSPSITTALWSARNGGKIDYFGVRFKVPRGWSARVGPSAAHFEKRPASVFSRTALVAWGAVARIPNPPRAIQEREQFYSNFAALYWTKLVGDQDVLGEPIRLGSGEREAFCMQSVLKNRANWYRTNCLIWRGTWRASFEGGPKDKADFFGGVLGLPDPQKTSGGQAGGAPLK